MPHRTNTVAVPAISLAPSGRALPSLDLDDRVERIVAVLPDVVPMVLKRIVPSASDETAAAIVADLIPRIRALRPAAAEQA